MTTSTTNTNIFITGANGGMGLETAKILASKNVNSITLATRSEAKAQFAKTEVASVSSKTQLVAAAGFDMTDPDAIERAVDDLNGDTLFDVIFFQVGGVFFTKDYPYVNHNGLQIEKTIFQNAIGAYITLQNLERRGLVADDARIIFAGGEGIRGIPGMIEKPEFSSVEAFRNYVFGNGSLPKFNMMNAIGVSKLALAYIVQKLAQQDNGKSYIWFSPGLTHGTNGLKAASPVKRFFMEKIGFGISGLLGLSQSPHAGAVKYVDSLLGKYGGNGDVLGAPDKKVLGPITDQKPMNTTITDPALIDSFWEILQDLYPTSRLKKAV